MTDDEARETLRKSSAWVEWDDETHKPHWAGCTVHLDGYFSIEDLQALLHFSPKEKP